MDFCCQYRVCKAVLLLPENDFEKATAGAMGTILCILLHDLIIAAPKIKAERHA